MHIHFLGWSQTLTRTYHLEAGRPPFLRVHPIWENRNSTPRTPGQKGEAVEVLKWATVCGVLLRWLLMQLRRTSTDYDPLSSPASSLPSTAPPLPLTPCSAQPHSRRAHPMCSPSISVAPTAACGARRDNCLVSCLSSSLDLITWRASAITFPVFSAGPGAE